VSSSLLVVHPLTTVSQARQEAVGGRAGWGKMAVSHVRPVREGRVVQVIGRRAGGRAGVATGGRRTISFLAMPTALTMRTGI